MMGSPSCSSPSTPTFHRVWMATASDSGTTAIHRQDLASALTHPPVRQESQTSWQMIGTMLPGHASTEQVSCPLRGVSVRTAALSAGMGVRNITPVPPIMYQKGKLHRQRCPAVSIKGEIQGYFCVTSIPLLSPVHSAFPGRLCWGSLLKATAFHLCDIRAEFPEGSGCWRQFGAQG